MDKEQEELQFIGFFGIWRESFKIIATWREIFLQLSLSLIIPLSFLYFAHTEINHLLTQNMVDTLTTLALNGDPTSQELATRSLSRQFAMYLLIQIAYIIFLFLFSLLSTSAVVYTVACIYTRQKVAFKEVMRVIPKVWKRLMVTFLCVMAIMFVYNFVIVFIITLMIMAFPIDPQNMGKYMLPGAIAFILYLAGVCYMSVIWQLANTISVLEESYGFQALRKSKMLMKGKMGISVAIFLVINLCVGVTLHLFNRFVVWDFHGLGMVSRLGFGVISVTLFCILSLVGLVLHTVFYLVCKSYHHERIDKSALSDHLEVYHGEGYILLKPKDIQLMEQV